MPDPAAPPRPKGASDRFGSIPFPLKRHQSPHGQVTAVSMMKDEAPYLIEWVAHHLAVGFTDLLVFTNDCSDGTDDMLIRLEDLGLVHHRRNVIPAGLRPQPSALNHAEVEPVVQQSDWIMVFDADEFLSISLEDGTVDGLLAATKAAGANGIVVTWRIFGSAGIVEWSRQPVTEQYLMAAPMEWNKGWGVKTLFSSSSEHWKLGIHRPKMKNRHIDTSFPDTVKWLNGSGAAMEDYFKFRGWRSITRTVGYGWVQLNHYAVKSVDSYALRKLRGNVNNKSDKYNTDYWSLQDRNEVRDETMLRYTEKRNQIMSMLLSDPELHRLHFAGLERVEQRLAVVRQTDDYRQLVADLAVASTVPITQIAAKPPVARDKDKIAALMSEVEKRVGSKSRAVRRAQPMAAADVIPLGSYVASPMDLSDDIEVEWVANQGLDLPLDATVFPASLHATMRKGKFERGLLRRIPQVLPKAAKVLEIGSGAGILGLHLRQVRPDLWITLQEDTAALRLMMRRIAIRNNRVFDDRLSLSPLTLEPVEDGLRQLVVTHAPQSLLLADPRLNPQLLAKTLGDLPPPDQIFLHGRLLDAHRSRLGDLDAALADLGYEPAFGFDPNTTRGYARVRG